MNTNFYYIKFLYLIIIVILAGLASGQEDYITSKIAITDASKQSEAGDLVNGNLLQFNDNGAWCWYQDERAVIDHADGKLIIGSTGNIHGVGGEPRDGDIDAVIFDLENHESQVFTLKHAFTSYGAGDDHNIPAFLVLPDGNYLAIYAGHNNDNFSYYRIYDGISWDSEQQFDWNTMPDGTNFETTYSNLFYLSAENRIYNIARSDDRSPNIMVSDDWGNSWSFGGQLTEPDVSIGYVNGYFKYTYNGVDRIDFISTEHHPRDYNTSIYHGYIKNGKSYKTDGTLLDDDITDKVAPNPDDYTLVFAANTVVQEITMTRCWTIDLQVYDDGTLGAIFKARANDSETDHRFFYSYYNGNQWNSSYLCKAGPKLYYSEEDYTGLGALDPDDPSTIYVSTTFDPEDDTDLGNHEIFQGKSIDSGSNWTWTPITQNSSRDNLRPHVPAWDEDNTALLWWRGTYIASQNFDAAVVGILQRNSENAGLKRYVDATTDNTSLANGTLLITTGPSVDMGAADDQWHERTGFGNGGSVLTSSEIEGEDAPALKTLVNISVTGTYDLWINFWANPNYDWRIKAGLSIDNMQLFRQMACKQIEPNDHDEVLTLSGAGNTYLYQAYLGRVQVSGYQNVEIFVDDNAIETGTESTMIGDVARTWYDGISYANIDIINAISSSGEGKYPRGFDLYQNYPNPFNNQTTITYSMPEELYVSIKVYNITGQEIATLVNKQMSAGTHSIAWNAGNVSSGIYFYKINFDNISKIRKMMLLK